MRQRLESFEDSSVTSLVTIDRQLLNRQLIVSDGFESVLRIFQVMIDVRRLNRLASIPRMKK
jgi:hypothetical protein